MPAPEEQQDLRDSVTCSEEKFGTGGTTVLLGQAGDQCKTFREDSQHSNAPIRHHRGKAGRPCVMVSDEHGINPSPC